MTKGPRYQPFDNLSAPQFEALKRDIEARGQIVPILVDEDGTVIDGHQRKLACAYLGVECAAIVVEGLSADEKNALAIAVNAFRRHLAKDQRDQAVSKLSALGWSNRRIASHIGTSEATVRRSRSGASDDAPDSDLPATPPAGTDPETGEVVSAPAPTGAAPVAPSSPRVEGKDGKSYAAKKPNPPKVDPDLAYLATFSRLRDQTYSGVLELDVERVARLTPKADQPVLLSFFSSLEEFASRGKSAVNGSSTLKAV